MASYVVIEVLTNILALTSKQFPPCSTPHFPNSCTIYQHQHLGMHNDQMVELDIQPALDPIVDMTMMNFWIEEANYAQTQAFTSSIAYISQVTQQTNLVDPNKKKVKIIISQLQKLVTIVLGKALNVLVANPTTPGTSVHIATNFKLAKNDAAQ